MGWDSDRFLDQSKLIEELFCIICTGVLETPLQTPCQHSFCKNCIIEWINSGNSTCPVDRQSLRVEALSPAILPQQLINKLIIKCKNNGCRVKFLFEDLPHLIEHENFFCTQNADSLRTENKLLQQEIRSIAEETKEKTEMMLVNKKEMDILRAENEKLKGIVSSMKNKKKKRSLKGKNKKCM